MKKFPHIYHFQKWKIALFWKKNCQDKHFFGEKLQKFANLGVKIEKNRVKVSNFALLGVRIAPQSTMGK